MVVIFGGCSKLRVRLAATLSLPEVCVCIYIYIVCFHDRWALRF